MIKYTRNHVSQIFTWIEMVISARMELFKSKRINFASLMVITVNIVIYEHHTASLIFIIERNR